MVCFLYMATLHGLHHEETVDCTATFKASSVWRWLRLVMMCRYRWYRNEWIKTKDLKLDHAVIDHGRLGGLASSIVERLHVVHARLVSIWESKGFQASH